MTANKFQEPVLHLPIQSMNFSLQFRQVCAALGFTTLATLLRHPPHELVQMEGFDLRMLNEYIAYLESEHLGFYLN